MRAGGAAAYDTGRTRVVGVIGGMGPLATADFFRRLVDATDAATDQEHLHVLIDSDPTVPDRTAFLLHGGPDPAPMLIAMARRLEAAGADLLVIACNTAHAVTARVAPAVRVPLLDWTDEAAAGVVAAMPELSDIGLLATDGTLAARLYDAVFEPHGIRVLVPDPPMQRRVMAAIYGEGGVKSGGAGLVRHRDALQQVAEALCAAGAQAILLGCTELGVLDAASPAPWPVPAFDAAELAARRVVELAGGRLREARPGNRASELASATETRRMQR